MVLTIAAGQVAEGEEYRTRTAASYQFRLFPEMKVKAGYDRLPGSPAETGIAFKPVNPAVTGTNTALGQPADQLISKTFQI